VVSEIGRRIGVGFEEARSAAEATVTVTARALNETDRQRFLARLPTGLHDEYAVNVPYPPHGLAGFVAEVGEISHRAPEVARNQAQAVLTVLAEEDRELIESVWLPSELRELIAEPPIGGGLVGPAVNTAPLTAEELVAALATLPYWAGNRGALRRTISLPPDNLDRVLDRIDLLRRDENRGPRITRDDPENATLVLRTSSVGAVTALDVDLAHRLDAAIDEAAAGIG
jgi:pterin-4a-carbinolamine dehydratase/uncharacterized protein (DUF2267 family)